MPKTHKMFGMLPEIYEKRMGSKKFAKQYMLKSSRSMTSKLSSGVTDKFGGIEWYINHKGRPYMYWSILITICQIASCFVYGDIAAFKHLYYVDRLEFKQWFWEILFCLDMFIHFFIDYLEHNPTGGKVIQRDLEKMAKHYYKTGFKTDFITLIPFQMVRLGHG